MRRGGCCNFPFWGGVFRSTKVNPRKKELRRSDLRGILSCWVCGGGIKLLEWACSGWFMV